jgi:hypothetical protein
MFLRSLLFTFLVAVGIASVNSSKAQLADGSIAPDLILTDLNGEEHRLYDYLSSGYTVFLEFFPTWCHLCWDYHNTGAFEELYEQHGPAGMPGVSANTTDDIMVFHIEVDQNTPVNALYGIGGNTLGNWVAGTDAPIVNDHLAGQAYNVVYSPTLYRVCPNKRVWQVFQYDAEIHYLFAGACPSPANGVDAELLAYSGNSYGCGSVETEVLLHNRGDETITARTLKVYVNQQLRSTFEWEGGLNPFDYEYVALGETLISEDSELLVKLEENDLVLANNSVTADVTKYSAVGSNEFSVQIRTDCWPSETRWRIEDPNGTVFASGGPYVSAGTIYNHSVWLPEGACYAFVYEDSYGDGLNGMARGCPYNGYMNAWTNEQDGEGQNALLAYNGSYPTDRIREGFYAPGANEDSDLDGIIDIVDNCPDIPNPLQADFNADGYGDVCSDTDADGLSDEEEIEMGTDPEIQDTDGDGITDWAEVSVTGTNPVLSDSNNNGVTDLEELMLFSECPEDITGDGLVNLNDLLQMLSFYGGFCE